MAQRQRRWQRVMLYRKGPKEEHIPTWTTVRPLTKEILRRIGDDSDSRLGKHDDR
jgi:hypothetical protein